MKFYARKSNIMWKRSYIYEGVISINFLLNLVFYIVNEDYFQYVIPKEIAGYMFWLSLGLYLGFQLCKYEFRRVWKNPGNN
jgi:hypothetical protein